MNDERLNWHPGFVEGLMGELDKNNDELDFLSELQLSKEPLRIDVVVVKKRPGLVIENEIGRIFRGHNIFEYKSPTDYISVVDFQKACAYVWLYAAETGADINDITLSFVSASHPEALFEYCVKSLGCAVSERCPGIYDIKGFFVPTQAIECRKLDGDGNPWLRNLRNDMSAADLEKLLVLLAKSGGLEKRRAYLNTVLVANAEILREVRDMYVTQEFRDVILEIGIIDDLLNEREMRGEQTGEKRGIQIGETKGAAGVLDLLKSGYTAEEIQKMLDAGPLPPAGKKPPACPATLTDL
ncbi:MAG: hypothetical protein LBS24_00250 [Clostridiales Family XIII bacterium]|nr:hypothetical protein [Clostridiales Family XIII bacterium]